MEPPRTPDTPPPQWSELDAALEGDALSDQGVPEASNPDVRPSSNAHSMAADIRDTLSLSGDSPSPAATVFQGIMGAIARDRVAPAGKQSTQSTQRFSRTEFLRKHTPRAGLWVGAFASFLGVLVLLKNYHGNDVRVGTARTYATGAYQQGVVNLGDGSRITLAPQTVLHVSNSEGNARTVSLDYGEAYFEIVHGSSAPFVVKSGTTTTQVLGTAFLVRHTLHDPHVRVAVIDGKVRVTAQARTESGVTLIAGQTGDVTDSTTNMSTVDNLTPGTEWAGGHILFRDTPLSTVLQTMSRWYGYQFRYGDQALGSRNVTMSISTQSSAEALAMLELVVSVNLTVVGDTVTLTPRPPQSNHGVTRIRTYDVWTPSREVGR